VTLTSKELLRAFLSMGGATLFFRGLSLFKEIYIANTFGLSSSLESYFIAFVYVGFPISVVIVPFQTSFIASLAKAKTEGSINNYQNEMFSSVIFITTFLIIAWVLILYGLKEYVFVNSEAVMSKVYSLLPFVFFNSINLILYGILQFKGFFSINGYLPTISPVCVLIGLFLYESLFGMINVDIIVVSIVLAAFIEFCILKRMLNVKFSFFGISKTLKNCLQKSYFLMLSSVVMAIAPMVEQYFSSSAQESGVVLLRYASIIPLAISGVFSTVVAVVVLPYFSKIYFGKDGGSLISKYWNFLVLYACTIAVAYFTVSIFSRYLLSIVYSDIISSGVEISIFNFNLYLVAGAFLCLSSLGVRLLSSMHKGKVIFVITIISISIEILILSIFGTSANLSIVPIAIICYFLMSFIGINMYIFFKVKA